MLVCTPSDVVKLSVPEASVLRQAYSIIRANDRKGQVKLFNSNNS